MTLTVEHRAHDDAADEFARSANPLQFRSQSIGMTTATDAERVPDALRDEAGARAPSASASPEEVERVVDRVRGAYLPRLQRCFRAGVERAGKLQLAFTVAESGEVRDARVTGLDAVTNACVTERVLSWSFSADRGGSGDASIVLSVLVM